ncbi:MAG: type II toxin-antitoxin system Phd/YefM family antitoxin [Telmatospirillum sp.]|nr:type II toxin-antitoxin system Phd/YefM family antitoxin [Telmatospirillum sp.]
MPTINIRDAKAGFSSLVDKAVKGESVTITRREGNRASRSQRGNGEGREPESMARGRADAPPRAQSERDASSRGQRLTPPYRDLLLCRR